MKYKAKFLLLFLVFSVFSNCSKISPIDEGNFEVKKLEILCKVWGFLKYYHPGASNDSIDWDETLLQLIDSAETISNRATLNHMISELINYCDDNYKVIVDTHYLSGKLLKENKMNWLSDTNYLSNTNSKKLLSFYGDKKIYTNKFVSQRYDVGNLFFDTENPYKDSIFPSQDLRLLALFRYWNIINYFYPYLDINDTNWNSILPKYIPLFLYLEDTIDYHLKVVELACELNDGHIWTDQSIPLALHIGIFSPPYKIRTVEGRQIVYELFPDSLGVLQDLHIGDQILEINNVPVEQLKKNRKKRYSFSNVDHFNRRISEELIISQSLDSMTFLILRNGIEKEVKVKPFYLFELYSIQNRENKIKPVYSIINDSIGYINLRYLEKSQVDSIMVKLMKMNKIIIDIRNYPKGVLYELSKYLNPKPTDFVKIFAPNIDRPGQFIWTQTMQTGINNDDYYRGKVVLIVNEQTQSHGEFTAMCLQASPNTITVGSKTAGTDGNVSYVFLPGGIRTYFTGIGIVYPDGTYTQRIGIKIDTIVKPLVKDVQNNYDRLLEIAINI